MAKLLSPEEYAAKFGGGRRAEAPQAGRGNLFGSAVDRTQAATLGIFEAYGDDVAGESRRRNQFEADETARRYYETNPDRIRSFREIRGIGDVGSYAADLGVQTAPALIGLGAASLAGGVPGALVYGTALGKGEILQAQREEAGQTDLMSATAGGLAFGAVDTLTGLGGAVVRRSLGTGIRSLDQAGTRALDDISGLKGVAARSAVAGGKGAATEALGETLQQGTVIGGRMAVNPDLEFFSPENVADLQESAFAGGLLGFGVSSFGGRRTRLERDEPVNLMGDTTTAPAAAARPPATAQTAAPRAVNAEQINQMVGLGRPSRDAKTYTAEFEEAFSEPSGQFVQDPQTGVERELTMGEYYARMQGLDTAPAAGAPAATTAAPAAEVDPRRQILRDTYGVVPTKPALQLVDAIEAEGLALDSPVVAGVVNFAAEKPMSAKRLEKAVELLDAAIIESRKAPIVSPTPVVRAPAPAALTQAAAPVVPVDGPAPAVSATPVAAAPVTPDAQAVTPAAAAAPVAAPAPAPAAPAAEQTAPDILNLVFGEQDADIIRSALSGQSAQQIADDLAARGVTGRSRSMIANKVAGEKAVREQWPRKIAEAKRKYNLTDAQIEDALRTSMAADADTRSEVEREMGLGFARATIAAPMSETEAVEAGLENVVGSVGGSTSAVQGFTDLQKKVDAVLDQIEKTTDPQVLAALQTRLEELAVQVRAVERSEQARVRADAGKETEAAADVETELEAPVERAAPKKAEAAPEKAEGETKAKGKKSKEEKEAEAEELSAEGKAARAAADAKLAAESAAKRAADRKGLVVGDTVMNPKLGTGVVKSFAGDGDATTVTVDFQSGQTKELSVKLAKLERAAGKAAKAAPTPAKAAPTPAAAEATVPDAVTKRENTMLQGSLDKLPEAQVEKLEKHYGETRGTDQFMTKLRSDVVDYINKGAEAVAGAVRSIIKSISEGVLAVGIVFNPNITADQFAFSLPASYSKTVDVRAEVPTAAAGKMSDLAKSVYERMAPVAKESGKAFIIADKPNGMLHAFNADGTVISQDSALYGKDMGDVMEGASSLEGGKKVTPAGTYSLKVTPRTDYAGGYSLDLKETYDGTGYIAVHAAYTGNKSEKRLERLKSTNVADKRISYGCINTSHEAFLNDFLPNIDKFNGGMAIVLPDNQSLAETMFEGTTEEVQVTTGGGAATAQKTTDVAAKPEEDARVEFGEGEAETDAYTTAELTADLKDFMRVDTLGKSVIIVDKPTDLKDLRDIAIGLTNVRSFGWTRDGKAVLIASRIRKGTGRAKFMHEVGSHLGMQRLLPPETFNRLVDQVLTWAARTDNSLETRLAKAAVGRVPENTNPASVRNEIAAYFVEEAILAGVNPTAARQLSAPVTKWMRSLFDAMKRALTKLGVKVETLTTRDVVNLAYGAASLRLESDGVAPTGVDVEFGMEPLKGPLKAPTTSTVEKNINALLPPVARRPARNTLSAIERMGRKSLDYVVFTSDLINRASEAGIKSAKQFGDLLAARATKAREMERDVERIADLYALVPEADRGTGPGSVNQFIFDSTREGKWGYDSGTMKANPEMKVRFDNLSPESQNLVRAMFDYGNTTLARKKKTVLDTTASEYDALIAAAKVAGDTAAEARLTNEKANTLKRFKSLFSIREGIPYAPIKRTGDHVVVAKSTEYIAAEEAGDTAKLKKLQADGDHYHVSFTDTAAQARDLRQQLEAQGAFNTVDDFEREGNMDALYGGESMLKALTAMRSKADAQVDGGDKSAAKLQSIISQLYLEALAEGSARKSEMKRRGVAGEVDMLSSFALQGRADANFLASLEYNSQVQDTLQKMRKERNVGGDRRRKSELFNELAKRYEGSLETPNNPWLDKLTRASSIYFLATSPSYYLQNLTQPFMMSLPAMAGRHDYGKSSAELVKAYGQLGDVIKSVKLGNQLQQQWDFSKVPADVRNAIETLADRGRIDIGLDTELGEFRIEGEGAFAVRWNKIDKALRTMVQKGEAINRLSTAMAAYRLELAKTKNPEAALDYADRILQETHGDYSRFNAPRAFNTPVGKVALQFRKFQLIQLTFYAKLINDALTGKDRAVALKTLGYALGHTAVLAGTMGLPGYAAISWALGSILGSDDEEFDLTDEIRKAIGDEELATMILRGAPTVTGMDISGKVGAGTMLSILPFSNADLTTRSGIYEAFGTAVGGASGGMVVRGIDGAQLMMSGDFYKGLEMLMPKGVSDAMKSYRIADEGMTRRNGDVILPPDEVNSLDAVFQALGIAPVKQTVVYEKRQRFQDMTRNFTDRTTRIKNNYVAAMRKGDTAAAAEAREAWKNLQDAKVNNGLKRSPLSDLLKAPREQQKRERNTRDGIQFNRSTQRAAEEIAER